MIWPMAGKEENRTNPCCSFETEVVPFYCLDPVLPGKPPVSVHDKSNMPGYGALTQGADEQLADLGDGPLCGWRLKKPAADLGEVH